MLLLSADRNQSALAINTLASLMSRCMVPLSHVMSAKFLQKKQRMRKVDTGYDATLNLIQMDV